MAALNVVHDRLKNIGLDDFVLEMHSNKVRKSDVLTKFGRTLELKQEDESDTFKQHASRIKDVKDRRNREVLDLHRVRNQGHSVYELITIYQEQGKVSMIAHCLAVISNRRLDNDINPERVAIIGLYHDSTEIITGDLPTPVKYFNKSIQGSYKDLEVQAASRLFNMIPEDLREDYEDLFFPKEEDEYLWKLVKGADKK